jgi:hypothetical protein
MMYIVRDKKTKKIVHVNPAPLSQRLEGPDIYYKFDPATMEVARGDLSVVPEHFDINAQGLIVPWTVQQEVEAGVRKLPPELKAVGDRLVQKTLAEKLKEGLVKLKPQEKVVGDRIEEKTVAEQVAEGLIKLSPTQVLDRNSIREMTDGEKAAAGLIKLGKDLKVVGKRIVPKSRAELAREKLIELEPDEKIQGDEVVRLTPRQMLDEKRLDLQEYKDIVIEQLTHASLEARREEIPDHELLYAALGLLDPARVEEYRKKVAASIKALDQAKAAVQKATTADQVQALAPPDGSRGQRRTRRSVSKALRKRRSRSDK